MSTNTQCSVMYKNDQRCPKKAMKHDALCYEHRKRLRQLERQSADGSIFESVQNLCNVRFGHIKKQIEQIETTLNIFKGFIMIIVVFCVYLVLSDYFTTKPHYLPPT